ncbi:MAG TPA: Spy/CpxP family protein refolding chaperone [Myxococcales bacterium]|nr:Spy/CpxP family protein refolding chaperone [Myxococcales bacterium]
MHPGMMWWWKHARRMHRGEEGAYAGEGGPWQAGSWHRGSGDDFGGGAFGVRRPLRFLAYKLNLSEEQVAQLAKVLDELKTERAQAAVDDRRTVAGFADAIGLETFDQARAREGGDLRVKSAERLRDAVVGALGKIHAVLDSGQRAQLAYLIRTGVLSI